MYNVIAVTIIKLMMIVDQEVCIDNTFIWYLILEYLGIHLYFFKEIHQSLTTHLKVNTSHNASKVTNPPWGSFMVWPIKTAFATPRMLYIVIMRKLGLGKPGYKTVWDSDSALCVEVKILSVWPKWCPKWIESLFYIFFNNFAIYS